MILSKYFIIIDFWSANHVSAFIDSFRTVISTARIDIWVGSMSPFRLIMSIMALMHLSDTIVHLKLSEFDKLASKMEICSEIYGFSVSYSRRFRNFGKNTLLGIIVSITSCSTLSSRRFDEYSSSLHKLDKMIDKASMKSFFSSLRSLLFQSGIEYFVAAAPLLSASMLFLVFLELMGREWEITVDSNHPFRAILPSLDSMFLTIPTCFRIWSLWSKDKIARTWRLFRSYSKKYWENRFTYLGGCSVEQILIYYFFELW